jgi:Spy/CpxP family protein refolding chaperone
MKIYLKAVTSLVILARVSSLGFAASQTSSTDAPPAFSANSTTAVEKHGTTGRQNRLQLKAALEELIQARQQLKERMRSKDEARSETLTALDKAIQDVKAELDKARTESKAKNEHSRNVQGESAKGSPSSN